jgi:hypothetical protein
LKGKRVSQTLCKYHFAKCRNTIDFPSAHVPHPPDQNTTSTIMVSRRHTKQRLKLFVFSHRIEALHTHHTHNFLPSPAIDMYPDPRQSEDEVSSPPLPTHQFTQDNVLPPLPFSSTTTVSISTESSAHPSIPSPTRITTRPSPRDTGASSTAEDDWIDELTRQELKSELVELNMYPGDQINTTMLRTLLREGFNRLSSSSADEEDSQATVSEPERSVESSLRRRTGIEGTALGRPEQTGDEEAYYRPNFKYWVCCRAEMYPGIHDRRFAGRRIGGKCKTHANNRLLACHACSHELCDQCEEDLEFLEWESSDKGTRRVKEESDRRYEQALMQLAEPDPSNHIHIFSPTSIEELRARRAGMTKLDDEELYGRR